MLCALVGFTCSQEAVHVPTCISATASQLRGNQAALLSSIVCGMHHSNSFAPLVVEPRSTLDLEKKESGRYSGNIPLGPSSGFPPPICYSNQNSTGLRSHSYYCMSWSLCHPPEKPMHSCHGLQPLHAGESSSSWTSARAHPYQRGSSENSEMEIP